jgi:hypothetical protein
MRTNGKGAWARPDDVTQLDSKRNNREAPKHWQAPLDLPTPAGPAFVPVFINFVMLFGKPCRFCGWETARTGPGVGPHAAAVICLGCDRNVRWLSKAKAAELPRRAAA